MLIIAQSVAHILGVSEMLLSNGLRAVFLKEALLPNESDAVFRKVVLPQSDLQSVALEEGLPHKLPKAGFPNAESWLSENMHCFPVVG